MKNEWKEFLIESGATYSNEQVHDFGNPASELEMAANGDVLADLSHQDRLLISGPDAQEYLQGQLSNDVSLLGETNSQLNTYCNPKGRMLALFRTYRAQDGFVLLSDHNIATPLISRLKMFVMRSKVTVEDFTDQQIAIGISGDKISKVLAKILDRILPTKPDDTEHIKGLTVIRLQGLQARYLLLGKLDQVKSLWNELTIQFSAVGVPAWEWLDIKSGLPSLHAGTSESFIPQMLNLDLLNALNFKKGCYPGQEIIARMKYLGKLKQRMFLGYSDTEMPVPGDAIFAQSFGTQKAGTIVNSQPNQQTGFVFLFVCQIKAVKNDSLHLQSLEGPEIELLELPYELLLEEEKET